MRVVDAAIGAAWAMEEAQLRTMLEIASREHEITTEALAAYKADKLEKGEIATFRDGVAILDVAGPLFKRANLMTAYCGASSYDVLMRDLQAALDDDNVRAILVNIDSPGGEVSGCAEFAGAIAAARGTKPIVAYAGDLACSAAYWIASACDRIIVGASAQVGSLGVRCTLTDTSARDERSGVRRFDFVSSQSPYKASDPSSADGAARLQARVDALAGVFIQAVADNRGMEAGDVATGFGRGDVLIGQAAIDAGMADGLGSFESTLARLSTATDPFAALPSTTAAPRGVEQESRTNMPTAKDLNAAVEAARAETTASLNAAHARALTAATAQAAGATTAADRTRIAGLFAACLPGYETLRDEAVQRSSSVATFQALLVEKEHARMAGERASFDSTLAAIGLRQPLHPARVEGSALSAGSTDAKAAAAILDAFRAFEPANGPTARGSASASDDAAADLILSMMPSRPRKEAN